MSTSETPASATTSPEPAAVTASSSPPPPSSPSSTAPSEAKDSDSKAVPANYYPTIYGWAVKWAGQSHQRRWFVLRGSILLYFLSDHVADPKGCLLLEHTELQKGAKLGPRKSVFSFANNAKLATSYSVVLRRPSGLAWDLSFQNEQELGETCCAAAVHDCLERPKPRAMRCYLRHSAYHYAPCLCFPSSCLPLCLLRDFRCLDRCHHGNQLGEAAARCAAAATANAAANAAATNAATNATARTAAGTIPSGVCRGATARVPWAAAAAGGP